MRRTIRGLAGIGMMVALSGASMASSALAQTTNSGNTSGSSRTKIARPTHPQLNLTTSIARVNSLYAVEGKETSSVDFLFAPSLKVSRNFAFTGLLEASQDLRAERFDFLTARLGVRNPTGWLLLGKTLKATPRLNVGFPISNSSKADSLQFSSTLGSGFAINPNLFASKRLSVSFDLSAAYYNYMYETSIDNRVNRQVLLSQLASVGWTFSRVISASLSLGHYDSFSQQGNHTDFISHGQEISIAATDKLSFQVGHMWGAPYTSTRKDNGQDLNLELTDEQNSFVYGQLTFSL